MTSRWKFGHGRDAGKCVDVMAALKQHGRKPAAHVAGAAGQEYDLPWGFHAALFTLAKENGFTNHRLLIRVNPR